MGTQVFKDKQIRESFETFYTKLFNGEEGKQFEESTANKLKEQDLTILNEDITQQEILNVMKNLKNGKSPALDGLSAEFYEMVRTLIFSLNGRVCLT